MATGGFLGPTPTVPVQEFVAPRLDRFWIEIEYEDGETFFISGAFSGSYNKTGFQTPDYSIQSKDIAQNRPSRIGPSVMAYSINNHTTLLEIKGKLGFRIAESVVRRGKLYVVGAAGAYFQQTKSIQNVIVPEHQSNLSNGTNFGFTNTPSSVFSGGAVDPSSLGANVPWDPSAAMAFSGQRENYYFSYVKELPAQITNKIDKFGYYLMGGLEYRCSEALKIIGTLQLHGRTYDANRVNGNPAFDPRNIDIVPSIGAEFYLDWGQGH